jgi:hypothetical protein
MIRSASKVVLCNLRGGTPDFQTKGRSKIGSNVALALESGKKNLLLSYGKERQRHISSPMLFRGMAVSVLKPHSSFKSINLKLSFSRKAGFQPLGCKRRYLCLSHVQTLINSSFASCGSFTSHHSQCFSVWQDLRQWTGLESCSILQVQVFCMQTVRVQNPP